MLKKTSSQIISRCTMCGGAMQQADVIPGMAAIASRTFECTACGHVDFVSEQQLASEYIAQAAKPIEA